MPGSLTEIVQAGVRRQVACLASTGPAGETEVAVVPYRADPPACGRPPGRTVPRTRPRARR